MGVKYRPYERNEVGAQTSRKYDRCHLEIDKAEIFDAGKAHSKLQSCDNLL